LKFGFLPNETSIAVVAFTHGNNRQYPFDFFLRSAASTFSQKKAVKVQVIAPTLMPRNAAFK
jgi:hypothetical protein